VKPLKAEPKGEIQKIELLKGLASATVKNTGNIHFMINTVSIKGRNDKGEEIFATDVNGWYLLSDLSRIYSTEVPREICRDLASIDVQVVTDKLTLNGKADVDTAMCVH
jgi:hypothetical protein